MSSSDSVGTLLAAIATAITDALRILSFSDKRQWGPDEHEQVRALEGVLDEARKDFQELGPLINGQTYYESDRKHESIVELSALRSGFLALVETLRDWSRSGGPIDPIWTRETHVLQRHLHRTQYRAARRIFASGQESSSARCLGAWLVHRKHRAWTKPQGELQEGEQQRRYREELRMCNRIGEFRRFGEGDVAFVCDFCDGHLVWEDLDRMPSVRTAQDQATTTPTSPATTTSNWQATGLCHSDRRLDKQIIFAPVAIANHIAPQPGDWQARILCTLCEESDKKPVHKDDEEDLWRYDYDYEDVTALQEHFEWEHSTTSAPAASTTTDSNCQIM